MYTIIAIHSATWLILLFQHVYITLPVFPATHAEKCTEQPLKYHKDTPLIRTLYVIPRVSLIEKLHCKTTRAYTSQHTRSC